MKLTNNMDPQAQIIYMIFILTLNLYSIGISSSIYCQDHTIIHLYSHIS